jgi:hypothetical protein
MLRRCLTFVNILLAGATGLVILFVCVNSFQASTTIEVNEAISAAHVLPKRAFKPSQESLENLGAKLLPLKSTGSILELPDLRNVLTYYGTDGRPDAKDHAQQLNFLLKGETNSENTLENAPMYIHYDSSKTPGRYVFSSGGQETALWLQAKKLDKEVEITVFMKDENGKYIDTPTSFAKFLLKAKEPIRSKATNWELGTMRVDGTLLARQKARWYGSDQFLAVHGGDEFSMEKKKQRIDFTDAKNTYSVFVSEGSNLVWSENRWKEPLEGQNTQNLPLLHFTKINERLMNAELWDLGGKNRVSINLIKSNDVWSPKNYSQDFRFLGLKTRKQVIVEVKGEKMILRPDDWLLLGEGSWQKLSSIESIDDYVERRTTGMLFVFHGLTRQNNQQYLSGSLYNTSRSASENILIPVNGSASSITAPIEDSLEDLIREEREEDEKEEAVIDTETLKRTIHSTQSAIKKSFSRKNLPNFEERQELNDEEALD